jgi:hypothetical protein
MAPLTLDSARKQAREGGRCPSSPGICRGSRIGPGIAPRTQPRIGPPTFAGSAGPDAAEAVSCGNQGAGGRFLQEEPSLEPERSLTGAGR